MSNSIKVSSVQPALYQGFNQNQNIIVIADRNESEFNRKILEAIDKGFHKEGSMSFENGVYKQVMVRLKSKIKTNTFKIYA